MPTKKQLEEKIADLERVNEDFFLQTMAAKKERDAAVCELRDERGESQETRDLLAKANRSLSRIDCIASFILDLHGYANPNKTEFSPEGDMVVYNEPELDIVPTFRIIQRVVGEGATSRKLLNSLFN